MTVLRIASLFNKGLRGLLQVAPNYMKPVATTRANWKACSGHRR
jgi:hypothetical protein